MPAPAEAQKTIDEGNRIYEEVYGSPESSQDLDVINNLPGAEPVVEPAAEPAAEPVVEPAAEPVVEPGPTDDEPGPTDDEPQDFEHKYSVLQGKYNAEVPRLNNQVKDLQSELNSMRGLLSSFEAASEPVEVKPGDKLLHDEEIEDYGQDMIDVIKRAAREELMPTITRLEEENSQLRSALGGVSETVTTNARDILYRTLNGEVPSWKEINQDSGFLEWLEGVDAFSGSPRASMLTQAFEDNDAARVVAFFKGYLSENATVTATIEPAAPTEPRIDLMSMAAPGTPRGGAKPGAHSDKRVYSHADIAAFYRSVQKGDYKGREDEKNAIEADIFAAQREEGRIR